MFQFRLGSIPVRVAGSHLLFSGLIGLLYLQNAKAAGGGIWPGAMLNAEGTAGLVAAVAFIASWALVVFVSVLIHELGHAVTSRVFGYQPEIELVWMGGHTRPNAPGPISWGRDILITFAGPLSGLLLAAAAYLLLPMAPEDARFAKHMLGLLAVANVFWSAINLIPVAPLDGGRISEVALSRFFGQKGYIAAHGLALLVCAAVIYWAIRDQQIFILLFFGSYAFGAYQLLQAGLKGEAGPAARQIHPVAPQLQQAVKAYEEGDLARAQALATPALEEDVPAHLRGFAHRMLGWVALKEGKGREALDHFSQVGAEKVEPQALAAAFSLVGDDARALPLWEQAYREKRNPTVLHEWAGALWREGKKGAALGLPGVDPVHLASCTTRVPHIRGEYLRAAALGEEALAAHPHYAIAYDTACAYARAGRPEDALRLLERAAELGFEDLSRVETDEDLASLRDHSAFRQWLAQRLGKRAAMTVP